MAGPGRARLKHLVILGLGYGFMALGVLGLFLPILQGILFILIGLAILSRHAAWARRLLERFKQRYPEAARKAHLVEMRLKLWWRGMVARMRP